MARHRNAGGAWWRRSSDWRARLPRVAAATGVAATAAAIAGAGLLALPQPDARASTTPVSTVYKTATDRTNGSTAASADAPGGARSGTASPGDTLDWVVSYQNSASAGASVAVTDVLASAGAYVAGSLRLPPSANPIGTLAPQFSTDNGVTWTTGEPPAGASGVGAVGSLLPRGTQQLSAPFVVAPSTPLSVTGGDAYDVVVHGGLIYAVYHHSSGPFVFCTQTTGGTCPGWPTGSPVQSWSAKAGTPIGTGTAFAGTTSQQSGTWIDGDRLYWFAGPSDNTSAGVGCLDLSTTTPTSCGYLPRTGAVVSNTALSAMAGGTGLPASDGNLYAAGTSGGSAVLFCTTPSGGACAGRTLLSGVTSPNVFVSAVFGDVAFASVQQTTASSWLTYCYNARLAAPCTGSWPVTTSSSLARAGSPFAPVLSPSGALTGVCTLTNGAGSASACWNLAGAALAVNPYAGTGATINAGGNGSGDALVIGSKVYVSAGNTVTCRDFGAYSGTGTVPACAGFTAPANLRDYTVRRAADLGPDCLVATGDGGQITFFDRTTGGACTTSGPRSVRVEPAASYCATGSASVRAWTSLSLQGLPTSAYASATVTLRDQNGAIVPGFDARALPAGQTLSLAAIPVSVTALTADVTLSGVTDPSGVRSGQISVAWQGDPPQLCFRTTAPPMTCDAAPATLTNTAKAVTTSTGGGDAPNGNTTGPVTFTEVPDPSRCALSLAKTSSVQTASPGDRVTYRITVTNTGSQAFPGASFADDLSDVLAEAVYAGDQAATSGAVSYSAPKLSWTGTLAPGASATITYSVTVKNPTAGDHTLVNTVVSPSRNASCPAAPASPPDPACTATVTVRTADVRWRKVDATASANLLEGAQWTLTPVDGASRATGPSLTVTDCVAATAAACTGGDADPVGGLFRVTGLGPGVYRLVEMRAPAGFVLDPTPLSVTIGAATTTVQLGDVVNHQQAAPAIPFTGGLGTDALTIGGGSALAAAVGLGGWHRAKRRRSG